MERYISHHKILHFVPVRGNITATGMVQEVGYRANVMAIARKLKLKGYIENVPDGSVKIICEGEKEVIEKFVKMIQDKNQFAEVEEVDVQFKDATNEFTCFQVKVSDYGSELFQGFATAGRLLGSIKNELGGKIDTMNKDLGVKIDSMHLDMNERFDKLEKNYGVIAEIAVGILEEQKHLRKDSMDEFKLLVREAENSRKESAKQASKIMKEQVALRKDFQKTMVGYTRTVNNFIKVTGRKRNKV